MARPSSEEKPLAAAAALRCFSAFFIIRRCVLHTHVGNRPATQARTAGERTKTASAVSLGFRVHLLAIDGLRFLHPQAKHRPAHAWGTNVSMRARICARLLAARFAARLITAGARLITPTALARLCERTCCCSPALAPWGGPGACPRRHRRTAPPQLRSPGPRGRSASSCHRTGAQRHQGQVAGAQGAAKHTIAQADSERVIPHSVFGHLALLLLPSRLCSRPSPTALM